MGGAVDVPGNVTPTAEFNIHVDPEAAAAVLAAGLSLDLVPLDATRQAVLPRADLERGSAARRRAGGAPHRGLHRHALRVDHERGSAGHGPCTIRSRWLRRSIHRSITWEAVRLTVEPDGETRRVAGAPNCRFARGVDVPRFLRVFLERLCARVLVIGSANVDFTVALSRLPRPGETVSEGTLLVARGGKGANQAVAARRLGAEVRLIGCVGDDASGREVRQALSDEGIGVDGARPPATGPATGTALIVVDRDGRNQIAVAPGANRALAIADVERREADFAWAEVVVCSLEMPLAVIVARSRSRAVTGSRRS